MAALTTRHHTDDNRQQRGTGTHRCLRFGYAAVAGRALTAIGSAMPSGMGEVAYPGEECRGDFLPPGHPYGASAGLDVRLEHHSPRQGGDLDPLGLHGPG